jgi:hypothetical protein
MDLYASPHITRAMKSRRMRWAGHIARMGQMRNAYNIFVAKPEGKRPCGRTGRRWEVNIRMDLWEIGWTECIWLRIRTIGWFL